MRAHLQQTDSTFNSVEMLAETSVINSPSRESDSFRGARESSVRSDKWDLELLGKAHV